jgi:lysophospholipase L1-like esterase
MVGTSHLEDNSMNIKGFKVNFLGDSITYGHGTSAPDKVFWRLLAARTGLEAKGYGVSGTRLARQKPHDPPLIDDDDFNQRALRMDKDADIVCVFGGTNDFGHGKAPIGEFNDTDPCTFYGALNTLYTYLITTYPHAFIFVMTPLHRSHEEEASFNTKNPDSLPLVEYVRIIRQMAERYSIPVLDLFEHSGIYPTVRPVRDAYMPDGLHPNDLGHVKLAGLVEQFLRNSYYERIKP